MTLLRTSPVNAAPSADPPHCPKCGERLQQLHDLDECPRRFASRWGDALCAGAAIPELTGRSEPPTEVAAWPRKSRIPSPERSTMHGPPLTVDEIAATLARQVAELTGVGVDVARATDVVAARHRISHTALGRLLATHQCTQNGRPGTREMAS